MHLGSLRVVIYGFMRLRCFEGMYQDFGQRMDSGYIGSKQWIS
jgi:hypothetical protein